MCIRGREMKTDITYTTDGYFITLTPNTKDGEYIWNEIAKAFDGNAKFPIHMKGSIFAQIRGAGYSVRKASKSRNRVNMADVFKEMEALGL